MRTWELVVMMVVLPVAAFWVGAHWGQYYRKDHLRWWRLRYLLFKRRWIQKRKRFNSQIELGR